MVQSRVVTCLIGLVATAFLGIFIALIHKQQVYIAIANNIMIAIANGIYLISLFLYTPELPPPASNALSSPTNFGLDLHPINSPHFAFLLPSLSFHKPCPALISTPSFPWPSLFTSPPLPFLTGPLMSPSTPN